MEDIWSPYRRYRRYLDRGFVELPSLIFPIVISGVQPRIARLATKCSSGGKTYTASMEFKYAMYQSSKDESIANKETLTFRQNGAWASSEDSPWRTVLIILWKDKRTRWLELCNSQEPQSEGNLCCRIRWTITFPIEQEKTHNVMTPICTKTRLIFWIWISLLWRIFQPLQWLKIKSRLHTQQGLKDADRKK